MKAVKALYRPSFVILVLQFITVLCCWTKLMHVGFMPEQWVVYLVCFILCSVALWHPLYGYGDT